MAISAENLTLSLVKEAAMGTTPTTPTWWETSVVSESLAIDATFTESEMIAGGTRGIRSTALTQIATNGDLNRELVFGNRTDLLFETLLGNAWGNDPHSNTITSDEIYDYTQLITMSIEKRWDLDGGTTFTYHRYSGQLPASATLDFTPGEIIQHNTSFIGMQMIPDTAIVTGATYVSPNNNQPMAAPTVTDMVITDAGTETPVTWMDDACFMNLSIAFDNNSRALACIGDVSSKELALGRLNITSTGSLYYTGDEAIVGLLAETEYGLLITAQDTSGNEYKFYFPRLKFTVANANATGQSSDVMLEFTTQMLQAKARKFTVQMRRTPFVVAAQTTAQNTTKKTAP